MGFRFRCYITYRVGYVICDTSLGPAEAQKEMEVHCLTCDTNVHCLLVRSDVVRLVAATKISG